MNATPLKLPTWLCICLLLIMGATGCAKKAPQAETKKPLPTEWGPLVTQVTYEDVVGTERLYLIQTPTDVHESASIMVYYHGANNDENQGMLRFPRLREWTEANGWLYVCPRDYAIDGLLEDLHAKHGKRPVYLVGASAGGGYIYRSVRSDPDRYAGMFLLGPAMRVERDGPLLFSIPTYIVYGDKDGGNTSMARLLVKKMKQEKKPILHLEMDGGHNVAYPNQFWWTNALEFVVGQKAQLQQ